MQVNDAAALRACVRAIGLWLDLEYSQKEEEEGREKKVPSVDLTLAVLEELMKGGNGYSPYSYTKSAYKGLLAYQFQVIADNVLYTDAL